MAVFDVLQDLLEEVGAGGHHHLVHLNLMMIGTDKGQVGEVLVLLQVVEGVAEVGREVLPTETKFLARCHHSFLSAKVEVTSYQFSMRKISIDELGHYHSTAGDGRGQGFKYSLLCIEKPITERAKCLL